MTLLPEHLEMVSKHCLVWMTAYFALVRSEARKAERGGRVCEIGSSSVARSSTSNVKDRLGPKRVPVWNILEKLPSLRIDANVTRKRKRHVEPSKKTKKGKRKMAETKKGKSKEP